MYFYFYIYFFSSEKGACLLNKPKLLSPIKKELPGSVMSLDKQCAARFEGYTSCKHEVNYKLYYR